MLFSILIARYSSYEKKQINEVFLGFGISWNSYQYLSATIINIEGIILGDYYLHSISHCSKYNHHHKNHSNYIDRQITFVVKIFLYRISGFSKIFRIIKIFILVLLPLIASIQVYSIASLILQFLSLIVVWKKFTYQLLAAEYYLLIGTICGIISSIDLLIYTLANQPYCYLG